MSSDHTADQPTPAGSATPINELARKCIWEPLADTFSQLLITGTIATDLTDEIIANFAAAGLRIVSLAEIEELAGAAEGLSEFDLAEGIRTIAAASEPAE